MIILKEKLKSNIANECYFCSAIRWHDIGLMNNFIAALGNTLKSYGVSHRVKSTKKECESSSGCFRNVANNVEKWEISIDVKGKLISFQGIWWQTGGTEIKMNKSPFIKAFEHWGLWDIEIDDSAVIELKKMLP